MRLVITDQEIRRLQPDPGGARVELADTVEPGLRLRLSPGGARVWRVVYRISGRHSAPRSYTLGPYSTDPKALTVARARSEARRVLALARLGQDPQQARVVARREERRRADGASFGSLASAYLAASAGTLAPSTLAAWRRYLERDATPALGDTAATEVTPEQIERLVARVRRERGPVTARRLFQVVACVYSWGRRSRAWRDVLRGLAAPTDDVLEVPAEPPPRDRVYSEAELRQIVAGVKPYVSLSLLVRLLLYTGTRPGEVRGAAWSEVDEAGRVWRLPAARTKARAPHTVPLSPQALAVLREARAAYPGSALVLPEWGGQWRTISRLRVAIEAPEGERPKGRPGPAPVARPALLPEDFRPHDLRRTVRQGLADMGVEDYVAEAILGHAAPRLRKTYAPVEPVAAMRAALERWGARVEAILAN